MNNKMSQEPAEPAWVGGYLRPGESVVKEDGVYICHSPNDPERDGKNLWVLGP